MNDSKPFFSIVIPTTRPHCLKFSLASALAQTFTDFEVVISHNVASNAASLDWLPADPRIRYVRPPDLLAQHDHWDFALAHARGRWQLLVGDDDAIAPSLLSIAAEVTERFPSIPIVYWPWCGFVDSQWPEPNMAGLASVPAYTAGTEVTDCKDFLHLLFEMDPRKINRMKRLLPSIMRGMYRDDLVEKVRQKTGGRLCKEWTPDYSAVAHVLPLADEMLLIDIPLLTLGSTRDSMAATYAGAKEFYADNFERAGRPKYRHIPIQSKAHSRPLIAETLMIARETLPEELDGFTVDLPSFLNWHHAGLMEMKALDRDVTRDEAEFEEVVARLDPKMRSALERLQAGSTRSVPGPAAQHFLTAAATSLVRRALNVTAGRNTLADPLARLAMKAYGTSFIYPRGSVTDIQTFVAWAGSLFARPNWDQVTVNRREQLLSCNWTLN